MDGYNNEFIYYASGRLSGVMDDRGKFIYISQEEMKAVADYVKRQGRVSISHLASKSNQFIDLEPKAHYTEDISNTEEITVNWHGFLAHGWRKIMWCMYIRKRMQCSGLIGIWYMTAISDFSCTLFCRKYTVLKQNVLMGNLSTILHTSLKMKLIPKTTLCLENYSIFFGSYNVIFFYL